VAERKFLVTDAVSPRLHSKLKVREEDILNTFKALFVEGYVEMLSGSCQIKRVWKPKTDDL